MELKQIEYFLELARIQHMSQTADFLNISQPTLSKSLHALERDVGVPLFDRVGNRIRLNASGKRFYNNAQQALQMLNKGTVSARELMYESSGELVIVCMAFAPIITPCVNDYIRLNPGINIQLMQYNHRLLSNMEAEGDTDFILASAQYDVAADQNTQFWVTQPLFTEECLLIIGPNHPRFQELKDSSEGIDLKVLSEERFITTKLAGGFVDITYAICQNAGFFPRSYFQTDDFLIKMNAIREGISVALIPQSCFPEAERLCEGLKGFRVKNYNTSRTVVMLRKKKSMMSETALDFWDFMLEYFNLPKDGRE